MALPRLSVIVAVDSSNGISKDGDIPWNSPEDMKYFRTTTIGNGRNAIIMGRTTYETIGHPLEKRTNIVISSTWRQEDYQNLLIFSSLSDALVSIGSTLSQYDEVFIIGGETVYQNILTNYLYLCDKIYVTVFKKDYKCDQFFDLSKINHFPLFSNALKSRDYTRYIYMVIDVFHDEHQYLNALENILQHGEHKPDRTGVGTRAIFGNVSMRFDIRERIPIITTKKTNYASIIKELLFFISGSTNTKELEDQGVKIWTGNTTREFLENRKLTYPPGDMGPMYGFQWRHAGEKYTTCAKEYKGFDQLQDLINNIKSDPFSRRHILCNWSTLEIDQMVLAPCHLLAQFNVSSDRKYLDCMMTQRSGDMFLGVPFNITSYCLLTYMIAHVTQLQPRYFTLSIGDAHIYNNHLEQASKLVKRCPKPFPKLSFRSASKIHEIDDFNFDSFVITDYECWPAMIASMAI